MPLFWFRPRQHIQTPGGERGCSMGPVCSGVEISPPIHFSPMSLTRVHLHLLLSPVGAGLLAKHDHCESKGLWYL